MTDSANTEIFENIFRIFSKHGLINLVTNIDEAKKLACIECIPIIKQMKQGDTNLYQRLEELMNVLNINYDEKNNLDNMFKSIIAEIITLKNKLVDQEKKLVDQEKKLADQDKRLTDLENSTKLKDAHLAAYDLLRLVLFYFVEPAIGRVHGYCNWSQFTSGWANLETTVMEQMNMDEKDVDDPAESEVIQNHELIQNFICPVEHDLQAKLGHPIELKIIRKMISERHQVAHVDTKTVKQQQDFIIKCKAFDFPQEYSYADYFIFFLNMIAGLDNVDKSKSKLRRVIIKK